VPVNLDNTDIAVLKSLMKDGRKSFRAISREIKVSTPTVKARYDRLVKIGLIKSVKPVIDMSKVTGAKTKTVFGKEPIKNTQSRSLALDRMKVKMKCQYCGGPIHDKPKVLEFAYFHRFFCCAACRADYKQKHAGRIQSIVEQFNEKRKQG
jgi:Lrp/AsnC family leucine-responsive transcriptional regulator